MLSTCFNTFDEDSDPIIEEEDIVFEDIMTTEETILSIITLNDNFLSFKFPEGYHTTVYTVPKDHVKDITIYRQKKRDKIISHHIEKQIKSILGD